MSKRKSTKDFSTILSSIFILLLVVGVVGFLFIFTENFTTPLKNFYVTCGNDDFISDRENFDIVVGKEYKFEITTNIDVDGTENKYIVSVVPNNTLSTNFEFQLNGETTEFASIESLSKGFVITTYDNYFTLTANNDLPDILELIYADAEISGCPTTIDSDRPYFKLVIQSADKSETININFNLKSE